MAIATASESEFTAPRVQCTDYIKRIFYCLAKSDDISKLISCV